MFGVAQSEISLPIGITTHELWAKWPWMVLWHVLHSKGVYSNWYLRIYFTYLKQLSFPTQIARKIMKKPPKCYVVYNNRTELCLGKGNIGHQIESSICLSMAEAYQLEASFCVSVIRHLMWDEAISLFSPEMCIETNNQNSLEKIISPTMQSIQHSHIISEIFLIMFFSKKIIFTAC